MDRVKDLAVKGWRKFRALPWWGQAIGWFLVATVLIGPFAGQSDTEEASPSAETTTVEEPPTSTEAPTTTESPTPTTEALPPRPTTLDYEDRLEDDLAAGAYDVCKQFVEQRLTSPGTAEFPDFYDDDDEVRVAILRNEDYRVNSQVDSENGFGALLRSFFECRVAYTGDDQWQLVDIVII